MNKRYIVGIAVIVLCGVIGFTAFKDSLTPYVGFAEAKQLNRSCVCVQTLRRTLPAALRTPSASPPAL